jgi:hypothetical protein
MEMWMADEPADAEDDEPEPGEPDWPAEIRALGEDGMGRAEIAAELGISLYRLGKWETEEPAIAGALAVADAAARAWWAARQREALLQGAPVRAGAWREAMTWRFGAAGKGGAAAVAARPAPRMIYQIPCNLRTRLRPDGTCPCDSVHDASWFRRTEKLRAWVIAGNDQNDFDDVDDEWGSYGDEHGDEHGDDDGDGDDERDGGEGRETDGGVTDRDDASATGADPAHRSDDHE